MTLRETIAAMFHKEMMAYKEDSRTIDVAGRAADKAIEAFNKILQLDNPYPETVFVPLSSDEWKAVKVALDSTDTSLDRVSADNMRYARKGCLDQIERAINE